MSPRCFYCDGPTHEEREYQGGIEHVCRCCYGIVKCRHREEAELAEKKRVAPSSPPNMDL